MRNERVTIRGIDTDAINEVREVAKFNSITLGAALSEAIEFWLDSLDHVADELPPALESGAN